MGSHLIAVALAALAITPDAPPTNCRDAATAYAAALTSVTEALRTYEVCLAASRGRNQCATEFDELDAAQLDYEDAVADYHRACPPVPHEPR
jgi:hypothetical protein